MILAEDVEFIIDKQRRIVLILCIAPKKREDVGQIWQVYGLTGLMCLSVELETKIVKFLLNFVV